MIHLLEILEIQHIRNGKVIWEAHNLLNTLHSLGEAFLLQCCFVNDGSLPPENYYVGLDNRTAIATSDLMDDLLDEPSSNGYFRQTVSSNTGSSIQYVSGRHRAITSNVTFTGTSTGWEATTLFLTNKEDNSGYLIASVALTNSISISGGDSISMRMALALQDESTLT